MSFEFRPLKNIAFDSLTDGRLEKHGVRVGNGASRALLSGPDGSTLIANREGASTHFEFRNQAFPKPIFDALTKEFGTEFVDENDFRFWGFSTAADMLASFGKTIDPATGKAIDAAPMYSYWVLAEGPSPGDAEFANQWLQSAIEADRLLQAYFSENRDFQVRISRLEVACLIEFAPAAMAFVGMWLRQENAFLLDLLDSEWAEIFSVMVGVGFFTLTGERYQITIPKHLRVERMKDTLLRLAATEDAEYCLHPEQLLTTMTWRQAFAWKQRLDKMEWQQRLADRDALLAD